MKYHVRQLELVAVAAMLLCLPAAGAADLGALAAQAMNYESGASEEPLRQIEQLMRESVGEPARRVQAEAVLIKMLDPAATFEAKRFACYTLAVYGTDASLPALAALLKKEETVGIACFALGRMTSKQAGECLRAALAGATGAARVQMIVTLGQRAEAESVEALAGLARDADLAVARAAVRALGAVDAAAARAALAALRREANPALAPDLAVASLSLADRLIAAGDR